jgi:hypothetical protein
LKNILILADGAIARHFVMWVGRKRVADNRYYVTCFNEDATPEKLGNNITVIKADPTSFARIRRIMNDVRFSQVFIVMENKEDARYALKNVRLVDEKILTVLVDQWDDGKIGRDEHHVVVLNSAELIAAHLYDHLPNVPVIAQNVGLGQGEIMEILVPFGSTYAYRHVGSILQRKWRIAALYRNEKLIIPTNATMIRPNDTLLVVGKPMVLEGIYRTINRRIGLFPEPYGKHLYLLLDFRRDKRRLRYYLQEAEALLNRLEQTRLYIRVLNPDDFELLDEIKTYESQERIEVTVNYTGEDIEALIEYDIQEHDIGWVLLSPETFEQQSICTTLWNVRKVVTLFGDNALSNLKRSVILMDDKEKMESISSTAFDAASSLSLELTLCYFDPEGGFEDYEIVAEHYETLAQIFNKTVEILRKTANPVREILSMEPVLHIVPFDRTLCERSFLDFFKTDGMRFLIKERRHPKLLVPYAAAETLSDS